MTGLRREGRFLEAAALARTGLDDALQEIPAALHLEAGTALAAVSDHPVAVAHLLQAAADPSKAPAALAKLAEISWVRHEHTRGQEYALEALQLDPGLRAARIQLRRNTTAQAAEQALGDTAGRVAHAAFHSDPHGNAGDLVLAAAVRTCLGLTRPRPEPAVPRQSSGAAPTPPRYWKVHVHQRFDEQQLARVNAGDGLVLGGGGLFLPDTAANGASGWQWNVTDRMLRRIRVPLVVWAVGYNAFGGQRFDGDRFAGSLRTLVEQAAFVGLRNAGSIERVRDLLPGELAEKVHWQPCPTTILSRLPEITEGSGPQDTDDVLSALLEPAALIDHVGHTDPGDGGPGPVLLNCAYDRRERRFGAGYGSFLSAIRDWVLATRERADVRYAAHCVDDETLVLDLRRTYGLSLPVIPMYDLSIARIQEIYRRAALVVGMRGHAGMIPFGCGTPLLSLISHPKLAYFLEDIGRPQWGVPVHAPDLGRRLTELTGQVLDDREAVAADVDRLQQRLFEVTLDNLAALPEPLRVVPAGAQR